MEDKKLSNGEGTGTDGKSGDPTTPPVEGTQPEKNGGKTFTQEELEGIIKERLDRERRKQEEEAKKAKEEADRAAMVANQEWKKLAEDQGKQVVALTERVKDHEALAEQVKQYEAVIQQHVEAQMSGIPDGLKALLAKLPLIERLEWITKNGGDYLQADDKKGPPALPQPERKTVGAEDVIAKKRKSGLYSGL